MCEPGAGSDVVSMRPEGREERRPLRPQRHQDVDHQRPLCRDAGGLRQDRSQRRPAGHHRLPHREGLEGLPRRPRSSTSWACAARPPPSWCSRTARCRPRTCMGPLNDGVEVLMSGLDYERAVLAAGPLGIMQACLDVGAALCARAQAVRPAHRRVPADAGQDRRHVRRVNACRAYVYAVARACDARPGPPARMPPARSSMPPRRPPGWRWKRSRRWAATAISTTTPTGRLLRDAKLYEIGAGTTEIRRMLIGRELFKKPPEACRHEPSFLLSRQDPAFQRQCRRHERSGRTTCGPRWPQVTAGRRRARAEKHLARGKLLPRDRMRCLLDPARPSWSSRRWRPTGMYGERSPGRRHRHRHRPGGRPRMRHRRQ